MNCFEARQEFASFWRRQMAPERRHELLAHLKDCSGCDRAFRAFALTAPVLHSEPAAGEAFGASAPAFVPAVAARRFTRPAAQGSWLGAMSAAAAMVVVASLAAYLSAAAPRQTLRDAMVPQTQPAVSSELIGALTPPISSSPTNNFAG